MGAFAQGEPISFISPMNSEGVTQRIERDQALLEQLWQAMRLQCQKLNIHESMPEHMPNFDHVELRRDSFDDSESIFLEWKCGSNSRGSIVVHANGSTFAEYDVLQAHPSDSRWFVEATTAWGRCDYA